MDIEEHELHYTPEAPLLGWRLFRVRRCDEGLVLSSPMYHDPEPPPWPETVGEARCYEDHRAPAPGCRCGIYAAVRGTLDSLPGYLLDTVYDHDPWVYAEVACTGRVFVDMRGVRAERAELVRIALPRRVEDVTRLLRQRYRVPVGGLDDVPAWVTGNRRDQGPPSDRVKLDLDLGKLATQGGEDGSDGVRSANDTASRSALDEQEGRLD
jgi:hypothetical protein